MPLNLHMLDQLLDEWERSFRSAALADGYSLLMEHLRLLSPFGQTGRPLRSNEGELMVEATIAVVRMCASYAVVDNQTDALTEFLQGQPYAPANAAADFVLTLDLCGEAFARVFIDERLQLLDLADLYGSPWPSFEVVGFRHLWISRPDRRDLTPQEIAQLQSVVEDDLFFDYSDDEIELQFDDSLSPTYLLVEVHDI